MRGLLVYNFSNRIYYFRAIRTVQRECIYAQYNTKPLYPEDEANVYHRQTDILLNY